MMIKLNVSVSDVTVFKDKSYMLLCYTLCDLSIILFQNLQCCISGTGVCSLMMAALCHWELLRVFSLSLRYHTMMMNKMQLCIYDAVDTAKSLLYNCDLQDPTVRHHFTWKLGTYKEKIQGCGFVIKR